MNETKDDYEKAIKEKDKINVDFSKMQKDVKNLKKENERAKDDLKDSES